MTAINDQAKRQVDIAYDAFCSETKRTISLYDEMITALWSSGPGEILNSDGVQSYNQMSLIMYWICFERYVKDVAIALFRCKGDEIFNLNAIGNKDEKTRESTREKCRSIQGLQLSLMDLYQQSKGFKSIHSVKRFVFGEIVREAGKEQTDASNYISFIRLFLPDGIKDPYQCTYDLDGESHICDQDLIAAIREMRNTLIHDGGKIKAEKKCIISKFEEYEGDVLCIETHSLKKAFVIIERAARNLYEIVKESLNDDKSWRGYERTLIEEGRYYRELLKQYETEQAETEKEIGFIKGVISSIDRELDEWYRKNVDK